MLSKLASICGYLPLILAQGTDYDYDYEDMDNVTAGFGYSWEPHQVDTDDGWRLSLLRITAVRDVPIKSDKPPVFMIHGAFGTGDGFMKGFWGGKGIAGLLAEQGYDVWLGNSRGTPYSNHNSKDGTWSDEEKWDFDWSDMGLYDIPAFVDKIIEVTEKPKVTLMGNSQGGAQIFYALAKEQDRYVDKVHRFVGLAPCHVIRETLSYEELRYNNINFRKNGIYNTGENTGMSMANLMYFSQIGIAKQFQEPISFEDWINGRIYSTPVDLSKIDRVPVSIVHPVADEVCDMTFIEYTMAKMQQEEKYLRFEHGGHQLFSYASSHDYV